MNRAWDYLKICNKDIKGKNIYQEVIFEFKKNFSMKNDSNFMNFMLAFLERVFKNICNEKKFFEI
jgi:hypothetical protein